MENGTKVNVVIDNEQARKLGISDANAIKNPCVITGKYQNGKDGYFMQDATGKTFGLPKRYLTTI